MKPNFDGLLVRFWLWLGDRLGMGQYLDVEQMAADRELYRAKKMIDSWRRRI